ncbi:MAG: alternative ribosome rescue aminoacyl-tRNA hydrolase ArfB [Gemmatimonadales bacterium]
MPTPDPLPITTSLSIPLSELTLRATTGGGPGGQHVNRSSTRIELWWDAAQSPSLTPDQRARVLERLGTRLTAEGMLRLVAAASRSQAQNKAEAFERFQHLLARAVAIPRMRRATRPTKASKERRLAQKKTQAARKRDRQRPQPDD